MFALRELLHLRLMALPTSLWRRYFSSCSVGILQVFRAMARVTANLDLAMATLLPVADNVRCCLTVTVDALSRDARCSLSSSVRRDDDGSETSES